MRDGGLGKAAIRSVVGLAFVAVASACDRPAPSNMPSTAAVVASSARPNAVAPAAPSTGPWSRRLEGRSLQFGSVDEAVAFLQRSMAVPVGLPTGLPADIRLNPTAGLYLDTRDGVRAAHLQLTYGDQRVVVLQFGVAVFDGCAPEEAVPTNVAGERALIIARSGPNAAQKLPVF